MKKTTTTTTTTDSRKRATSFSSLIKEIKRRERKKPQAEGSLHFTIVELLEELDPTGPRSFSRNNKTLSKRTLSRRGTFVSEDYLCQARVTVAILLIVQG